MAITISFGIQKGGVGKTTVAAITSFLLSLESRVLAIDFDSQGNLTQFLTQRNIYDFTTRTVLEAVKEKNAARYTHAVTDNLHLLPAEDLLSTFSRWLYREYRGDPSTVLRETLSEVKGQYDYIVIDLPPNLGDQTINGLTASDYAVVLLQSEPFCYDALDRYIETLRLVQQQTNPTLLLAGILTSMMASRMTLDTSILEQTKRDYEEVVFDTVIRRRSRIKEYSLQGIQNKTKADRSALLPYQEFLEELKQRVQQEGQH